MKITKDTVWTSYQGVAKPLNELEDSHLANIIHHVKQYGAFDSHPIVRVCEEILTSRGVGLGLVDYAQIPHKNLKGQWAVWDYKQNRPITFTS
tara:strand:- start:4823 stop:5101 length:279 start_codon:yes stop_codon:yes gene_type:complete